MTTTSITARRVRLAAAIQREQFRPIPKPSRRDLTLAPDLRAALRGLAEAEGINVNTLVVLLIREGLDHRLQHGGR
jgi:hypothetical protein